MSWPQRLAFFMLGTMNNLIYVVILSAATDLVPAHTPHSLVLLMDILPSLLVKLCVPWYVQRVREGARVSAVLAGSFVAMMIVSRSTDKLYLTLSGIALASAVSGLGDITFLMLTASSTNALSAYASGTGFAGVLGAVGFALLTSWYGGMSARSVLAGAGWAMPVIMASGYYVATRHGVGEPDIISTAEDMDNESANTDNTESNSTLVTRTVPFPRHNGYTVVVDQTSASTSLDTLAKSPLISRHVATLLFVDKIRIVRTLIRPYMLPMFIVYTAEYTINQGVAPTLLYPLNHTPFHELRDHYVTYQALYQIGVFLSRSSLGWVRLADIMRPAMMQVMVLCLLIGSSLSAGVMIPSIWIVFAIIAFEGLLGGATYVNCFALISEQVSSNHGLREFSVAVVGLADSLGITVAAILSLWLEPWLCAWQVKKQGVDLCLHVGGGG